MQDDVKALARLVSASMTLEFCPTTEFWDVGTAAPGPQKPRAVPRAASGEKLRLLRLQMVTSPPPFTTISSSPTSPSSQVISFSFEYANNNISSNKKSLPSRHGAESVIPSQ
ncbi:hypothetical protein Pmani_036461 [Petrolisthes manimaculis]|uniref:Uncharacterized protein n=1 Tax=Petrolisthes manimaculis TaxID=1843537 RepID=A0AAE1TPC6_9EUCA|nr:hypothetical protein Pmani_036461 [Petrolisthes manimaculis]